MEYTAKQLSVMRYLTEAKAHLERAVIEVLAGERPNSQIEAAERAVAAARELCPHGWDSWS
jgi:hypothetical protein